LAHLGISEGCTGKKGEVCIPCPVAGMCGVVKTRMKEEGGRMK
jgi:hypothetical protein